MVTRHLPGDILLRRKGFVLHKGIALGNGRVFHNTPIEGEHVSTEERFRAGHRVYVKRLAAGERRRTVGAARTETPRRYNLLTNNCEHTVSRARTGEATSRQLEAWAVGLGLGALAFAATRRPSLAVAGFALGASAGPRALELVRRTVRRARDD